MTPEQLTKSGTEDAHQMALFAWAALNTSKYPQLRWLHAIPNGGLRSARTGAKMKATGARKGVWDVFLPVPIKCRTDAPHFCLQDYHGLYIEMKKPGKGRLTDEQKEFRKHLDFYGYANAVCFTWDEAAEHIETYLKRIPASQNENYKVAVDG